MTRRKRVIKQTYRISNLINASQVLASVRSSPLSLPVARNYLQQHFCRNNPSPLHKASKAQVAATHTAAGSPDKKPRHGIGHCCHPKVTPSCGRETLRLLSVKLRGYVAQLLSGRCADRLSVCYVRSTHTEILRHRLYPKGQKA